MHGELDQQPPQEPLALGALLELLHGAEGSFASVQVTYRTWRHAQRSQRAWRAAVEEQQRRRPGSIRCFSRSDASEGPAESEALARIWRDGARLREQHEGGWLDGQYGVRDGDRWWLWNPISGAAGSEGRPGVHSSIGEHLAIMFDPSPLLGLLSFTTVGRGVIAGRETVIAEGVPRRHHDRLGTQSELGAGAERYRLQIDADRGVLLEAVALSDGKPFQQIAALAIEFDLEIPEERFRFEPPAGAEIRSPDSPRAHPMSLREAARRAPFVVLVPGRVPDDWHSDCLYLEPMERPPWPVSVTLTYHSEDGHHDLSISQFPTADSAPVRRADDDWEPHTRDGRSIRVSRPEAFPEPRAELDQDGTFLILSSRTLDRDELLTIAASMKPAPEPGIPTG